MKQTKKQERNKETEKQRDKETGKQRNKEREKWKGKNWKTNESFASVTARTSKEWDVDWTNLLLFMVSMTTQPIPFNLPSLYIKNRGKSSSQLVSRDRSYQYSWPVKMKQVTLSVFLLNDLSVTSILQHNIASNFSRAFCMAQANTYTSIGVLLCIHNATSKFSYSLLR